MLNERTWTAEALVRLVASIFLCLSGGVLLAHALLPAGALNTAEGRFFAFVVHSITLHGGAMLCVAAFLRAHGVGWREGLQIQPAKFLRALGLAVAALLVVLPLALVLQQLSALGMKSMHVEPQVQTVVQTLQQTVSADQRFFFALVAIVFAPVVEEVLFRGILYPAIRQRGYPRLALWGTSLVFALTHANMMTFLPLTLLALALVALYEFSGNLLAPILAHSLFNATNFVLLIFEREILQLLNPA